jgi:hypothetical protein
VSAVEVVAEALAAHQRTTGMAVTMGWTCRCRWYYDGPRSPLAIYAHQAEAVLAALAAASPQVQAEAIGGRHERGVSRTGSVFERAVGPWREVDQ